MRRRLWLWICAALVAGCDGEGVRIGTRAGASPDTVVFGQDREAPATPAADERGRLLLERMLDQYAGLGFLLEELEDAAAGGLSRRAFAHERHEDRHELILTELLREGWGERYVASVPPAFTAVADSIRRLPPDRRDAALSRRLLAEHRRGLQILDSATPGLVGTRLERPMRELSEDLVEEIGELEDRLDLP
jgi:hypothetical protein